MADTSLVFNLVARERVTETLNSVKEKFAAAGPAIGASIGVALGAGAASALNMEAANDKLQAQLGVGADEAAELAKVSANVYQNAWGESTAQVNDAIRGVYQNIGDVSQAEGGLEGITTKTMALAQTFDQELGGVTASVGQLLRTGLASDADEAFDILTKGFQSSANKADDLLDTINEYSTQWRRLGLDGQTATGLLSQGLKAGARDADQVADAIGQFGELALAGGKGAQTAFQSIGLDAKTMGRMIGQGGESSVQALQMTLDKLRGTKDEQVKLNAATALFGDPGTVMGEALFALDPATAAASAGMDKAKGSAQGLVDTVGDNAQSKLTEFQRKVEGKLAEAASSFITFAEENRTVMEPLAYTLGVVAVATLAVSGAMKVYAAGSAVVAGANAILSSSTWTVMGNWLRMMAIGTMAYLRIAGQAVISAAVTAGAWLGSALTSIGTWIASVVRAAAVAVAQFALMAARAVAWAVIMAAQWLIAMGPIGWIIAAVVALAILIIANWDKIKRFAIIAWEATWSFIKGIGQKIWQFFLNWTLVGLIIKHWDKIYSGTVRIATSIVNWVRALPGRIAGGLGSLGAMLWTKASNAWTRFKNANISVALSAVRWVSGLPGRISRAVGSLGSLLYNKGQSVVTGLWNGIKSMGGWLKSTLLGWAADLIPGPIAKALGIGSPSKVMASVVGRWIPAGIVQGIEQGQPALDATMRGLVQPERPAMARVPLVQAPASRAQQIVPVIVDITGGNDDLKKVVRKWIRVDGGGNVQKALGG
ncbi:phage tail tape measure protein [Actinacidiphila glaucinigra]|uniref:phage tail tape measure protein n=1 Tax=Actinacidiphila glaucinigra TaxID=235986 RepID=UPI00339DAD09